MSFAARQVGARTAEIKADISEEHVHTKTRWYTKKGTQGTNDWAALLSDNLAGYYRCISGNNTWGADANDEALLFGTDDVLWDNDFKSGDFDEILVVANSSSTIYLIRIIWGSGTMADAIAAGQYSTTPYLRATSDTTRVKNSIKTPKIPITDKIWMQCMNASNNATIDFVVGVHGYDEEATA